MSIELLLIAIAYFFGLAASQLRLPPLVGYLGAGYLLYELNIRPDATLTTVGDFGIELLLFTVGLKLDVRTLARRDVLGAGTLHMLVVTTVAAGSFLLLGGQFDRGLLLGISLAFSSTVLAVKILEDNAELSTLHGRIALGILIYQDIVAVGLLALVGVSHPSPWAATLLLLPILRPLAFRCIDLSKVPELRLMMGVTLALGSSALAQWMGVSAELTALWMGALLAGHPDAKDMSERLWGIKEMFLVAFFMQIGMAGLPTLSELQTALQLLVLLPLQAILFFLLFILLRLRARTAFITSLALCTYSEFALITTKVLTEAGWLPEKWKVIMGASVALSLAVAAPVNRYSNTLFTLLEPWLLRWERRSKHPDRIPSSLGGAQWLVMGMGRTGKAAYESLEAKGYRVVGLDADPTRVEKQRREGMRLFYGDAEDHNLWEGIRLAKIKGVILCMPDFDLRMTAIRLLRGCGYSGLIGTTSQGLRDDAAFMKAGADVLFHPLTEAGSQLAARMLEQFEHG